MFNFFIVAMFYIDDLTHHMDSSPIGFTQLAAKYYLHLYAYIE